LNGEDDDPAAVLDANGTIHLVWFSDRDGTKDLYYVHSTAIDLDQASIAWTQPIQITHLDPLSYPPPTRGDNYPALLVDADGTIHVAWHRWNLANECHIHYLKCDGTPSGWVSAVEVSVTSGQNFDRFPHLVRLAPDDLRIYFGSSTRVFPGVNDVVMAKSSDQGATWVTPLPVPSLQASTEHTQFPTVVMLAPSRFAATLDRWQVGATGDALDPTTDVFYAESSDAEHWTVDQVTHQPLDDVHDFVPAPFFDHQNRLHLAWSTTGLGDPAADIVSVLASERALYPAKARLLSPDVGRTDHSPRVLPVTVGGRAVYVMVWVRIVNAPHNQVGYRIFSKL